jgi:hypothetical protein
MIHPPHNSDTGLDRNGSEAISFHKIMSMNNQLRGADAIFQTRKNYYILRELRGGSTLLRTSILALLRAVNIRILALWVILAGPITRIYYFTRPFIALKKMHIHVPLHVLESSQIQWRYQGKQPEEVQGGPS